MENRKYNNSELEALEEFNNMLEVVEFTNVELSNMEKQVRLEVIYQSQHLDHCESCGFTGILMRKCVETGYLLCECGEKV